RSLTVEGSVSTPKLYTKARKPRPISSLLQNSIYAFGACRRSSASSCRTSARTAPTDPKSFPNKPARTPETLSQMPSYPNLERSSLDSSSHPHLSSRRSSLVRMADSGQMVTLDSYFHGSSIPAAAPSYTWILRHVLHRTPATTTNRCNSYPAERGLHRPRRHLE